MESPSSPAIANEAERASMFVTPKSGYSEVGPRPHLHLRNSTTTTSTTTQRRRPANNNSNTQVNTNQIGGGAFLPLMPSSTVTSGTSSHDGSLSSRGFAGSTLPPQLPDDDTDLEEQDDDDDDDDDECLSMIHNQPCYTIKMRVATRNSNQNASSSSTLSPFNFSV